MCGGFTKLEVRDPYLLGQTVAESFPLNEKASITHASAMEWAPRDRKHFRIEPERYRTEYSYAKFGGMYAVHATDTCATLFTMKVPATEAVWIVIFERGAGMMVRPGSDEPTIGNSATGLIRDNASGIWSAQSDGNSRQGLWVPAGLLRQRLEVLLEGERANSLALPAAFDQTRGAGATIRRMIESLFVELARSDSLLANEIALRSFQEHLLLCLLLGLPHSCSARLLLQRTAAAPANVKRAEEFMRANVRKSLTIEAIANAAGCGIRALQLAFRQFRDTTPMAALRRIRLEAARAEVLRPDQDQSLARIAAEHGFSNPSRFAQLFRRAYGVYPSESLQTRRKLARDVTAQVIQLD
jgi:AraC-like DNA-binding protein